jgi:polar amino acid transport system substrate-binding protein
MKRPNTRPSMRHVLAALGCALPMAAAAQGLTLLTEENPPFNYTQSGKVVGLATETIAEMAKRAGVQVSFQSGVWDTAYKRAQAEKNTCLYSTVQLENRRRLFHWVGPIASNRWVLVAKSDFAGSIKTEADARKYRIGAVKTDAKAEFLRSRAITNIVESDTEAQIPAKFNLPKDDPQRIDLWAAGLYAWKTIAGQAKVSGLKPVYEVGAQPYYLACSPLSDDASLKKLSAALETMRKDGAWGKRMNEAELRHAR